MIDTHTLGFKGGNIHYYTLGDASKEAVFLLHPAFADHHIFQYQFDALSKDFYIISMDFIGHGKSNIKGSSANMGDMPDAVLMILDTLGVEKAHLVGVSIGSLVAQGIADRYPNKVKTVTIVGGYSIHKDNKHIQKAQAKEMGKWIKYIIFNVEMFKAYIVESSSYSKQCQDLFSEAIRGFKRGNLRGMSGMGRIMRDTSEPITYPLLVIAGQHDLKLARDAGKKIEETEPQATYCEIADAGHCANADQPEVFNAMLEAFISQYSS